MFGSFHCVAMMLSGWFILAVTSVNAHHHPTPLLITQPYHGFFYFPYRHYDAAVNLWNPESTRETFRPEITADFKEATELEGRTPGRKVYSDHLGINYGSETLETEARIRPLLRNAFPNFVSSVTSPLSSFFTNPLTFGLLDGTPCTSPNAEAGICTNARLCSNYGGRSSGSCNPYGSVCCINTVTRCGATVTLNNTYWQAPTTLSAESTCSLTVKLDPTLVEQKRNPICQVRLDFEAFSIAGPNTQTVCAVDNFRVSGTANKIPIICGQNIGQHMYLIAPSSTADIQMIFTSGTVAAQDRDWKIRISLIACSSTSLLAPEDCLQYFTQSIGTVRSFNWREVSPSAAAPRQLANQDYNICFRTERIINTNSFPRVSSSMCYTPCVITTTAVAPQTNPLAFSLTGDSRAAFLPAGVGAGANANQCPDTDYLIIRGAVDSTMAANFNDRFCGNNLNAVPQATSVTLCSTAKPFNLFYRTDGSETNFEFANNGFCLRYEQRP